MHTDDVNNCSKCREKLKYYFNKLGEYCPNLFVNGDLIIENIKK